MTWVITRTLKCDLCGKTMERVHMMIVWPSGSSTQDVCHDCTRKLNDKLNEIRKENGYNAFKS